MKHSWILMTLLALVASAGAAQAADPWLELMRADLRADKVAIVEAAMPMNTAERDLFWPIYRDYDREMKKLGDRRIALLEQYAKESKNLTDEGADALMQEWFSVQTERTKVWQKYYKKVSKEISAGRAARFIQIEHQIALLIDLQVASELPLIHTVDTSGK